MSHLRLEPGEYTVCEMKFDTDEFADMAHSMLTCCDCGYTFAEHPELGTIFTRPGSKHLYVVPPDFMRWMVERDLVEPPHGATNTRN